jgi:septal ring factor EnvC (AmiA/AmiB activator)
LRDAEQEKAALLEARRDQSSKILAALQRLAVLPPEAVIAQPVPPADLVRGAILLRATLPRIEDRAARLRDDLHALRITRSDIADRRLQLARRTEDLAKERGNLEALLSRKDEQRRDLAEADRELAKRLNALAEEAGSLRELFQRLDEERRNRESKRPEAPAATPPLPPEPVSPSPDVTGASASPYPAAGRLVGRYGESIDTGMTRKGIDLETRADAQVVATYDGRIVFAGHFRGYGQLLIIEHGEGYHSLLAGMARIDGTVGQSVLAGEPVGRMGNPKTGKPSLYVELRRDGQPVNPVPWLIARKGK